MANNSINFSINFNTTQGVNQINQLKTMLQQIQNLTIQDIRLKFPDEAKATAFLTKLKSQAIEVQQEMNKAFNPKLGMIDATALKGNSIIQNFTKSLGQLGIEGETAAKQIALSLEQTNLRLKQTSSFVTKMGETLFNTIRWQIATKAINSVTGAIQKAYYFTKDLDSSLNDIRIVTNKSAGEMDRFALSAAKAAKELGKTTTDYTNASLIYYQQGLSDSEVKARTNTTLKAASVTGQSASEVSEQLTAVWNGYRITAENTESAVDKLAAVAASTATDLEELSTGMSKVASAANQMGVDLDQLNAQIATIVSVTRQAPESVGTALKTVYARMATIKAGGIDEEDGATLTSYTEKMNQFGINVLDTNGKLRDMGGVIEEIGEKWSSFSREAQIGLAQAMAGTRQYANLTALFENWDMYQSSLKTSQNAEGTLEQQNQIYLESVEASFNQLRAQAEQLYQTLFDPDVIKDFVAAITKVVEVIDNLIKSLGGVGTTLGMLASTAGRLFSNQLGTAIARPFINASNKNFNKEQIAQSKINLEQSQALMNSAFDAEKAGINQKAANNEITNEEAAGQLAMLEERRDKEAKIYEIKRQQLDLYGKLNEKQKAELDNSVRVLENNAQNVRNTEATFVNQMEQYHRLTGDTTTTQQYTQGTQGERDSVSSNLNTAIDELQQNEKAIKEASNAKISSLKETLVSQETEITDAYNFSAQALLDKFIEVVQDKVDKFEQDSAKLQQQLKQDTEEDVSTVQEAEAEIERLRSEPSSPSRNGKLGAETSKKNKAARRITAAVTNSEPEITSLNQQSASAEAELKELQNIKDSADYSQLFDKIKNIDKDYAEVLKQLIDNAITDKNNLDKLTQKINSDAASQQKVMDSGYFKTFEDSINKYNTIKDKFTKEEQSDIQVLIDTFNQKKEAYEQAVKSDNANEINTALGELENAGNELANKMQDVNKGTLTTARTLSQELPKGAQAATTAMNGLNQATSEAAQTQENLKKTINAQNIVTLVSSVGQLASGVNMLKTGLENLGSGNILQGITGITSGLTSVSFAITGIKKALVALEMSIPAFLIVTGIIAAAVTLIALIKENSPEKQLENAKEEEAKLRAENEKLQESFDNLTNSIKTYEDSLEAMSKAVQGTEEYTNALAEANRQAEKLIESNEKLAASAYRNAEGLITFDEEALSNAQSQAQKAAAASAVADASAKANVAQKQIALDIGKSNINISAEQLSRVSQYMKKAGTSSLTKQDVTKLMNEGRIPLQTVSDKLIKSLNELANTNTRLEATNAYYFSEANRAFLEANNEEFSKQDEQTKNIVSKYFTNSDEFNKILEKERARYSEKTGVDDDVVGKAYAKIMGYDFIDDNWNGTITFKNASGDEFDLDDETVREAVASYEALQEANKNSKEQLELLYEQSEKIKQLGDTLGEEYNIEGFSDMLYSFFLGHGDTSLLAGLSVKTVKALQEGFKNDTIFDGIDWDAFGEGAKDTIVESINNALNSYDYTNAAAFRADKVLTGREGFIAAVKEFYEKGSLNEKTIEALNEQFQNYKELDIASIISELQSGEKDNIVEGLNKIQKFLEEEMPRSKDEAQEAPQQDVTEALYQWQSDSRNNQYEVATELTDAQIAKIKIFSSTISNGDNLDGYLKNKIIDQFGAGISSINDDVFLGKDLKNKIKDQFGVDVDLDRFDYYTANNGEKYYKITEDELAGAIQIALEKQNSTPQNLNLDLGDIDFDKLKNGSASKEEADAYAEVIRSKIGEEQSALINPYKNKKERAEAKAAKEAYESLLGIIEEYNKNLEITDEKVKDIDNKYLNMTKDVYNLAGGMQTAAAGVELIGEDFIVPLDKAEEFMSSMDGIENYITEINEEGIHIDPTEATKFAQKEFTNFKMEAMQYINEMEAEILSLQAAMQTADAVSKAEMIEQIEDYKIYIAMLYSQIKAQEDSLLNIGKAKTTTKEMKDIAPLKSIRDAYHDINIELDQYAHNLAVLQKKQEFLASTTLVKNLEKQLKVTKQQTKATEEKLKIAASEAKTLREQTFNFDGTKALSSYGIAFDAEGYITNYDKIIREAEAKVESARQTYQANKTEENEKAYEKLKDELDDLSSDIDEYESYLKDLQSITEDWYDQKIAEMEKKVEIVKAKIDVTLEMSDATKMLQDWKEKYGTLDLNVRFSQSQSDIDAALAESRTQALNSYLEAMPEQTRVLNEGVDAYNKLNNGADFVEWNGDIWDKTELLALKEGIDHEAESLDNIYANAADMQQKQVDALRNAVKEIEDWDKTVISHYENINKQFDHALKLTSLMYGENSLESKIMKEGYAQGQYLNLQDEVAEANRQTEEAYTRYQEVLKTGDRQLIQETYEAYNSHLEELQKLIEQSLEKAQEVYKNQIDTEFTALDMSLLGGARLDQAKDTWELINKQAEMYLDTINAQFGVQQLENKYLQAYNKAIGNVAGQQKINKIMNEELAILQEKDKLTKYDLERANARYDLMVKQIALEEAQQNKTNLRLRRDSQGNYTYQYTANEDDILAAQGAVGVAQNNLYNIDRDRAAELGEQFLSVYEEYKNKIIEVLNDPEYMEDEEKRNQKLAEINEAYIGEKGIITALGKEYSVNMSNLSESIQETIDGENGNSILSSFANLAKQGPERVGDLVTAAKPLIQEFAALWNGDDENSAKSAVKSAIDAIAGESEDSFLNQYKTKVNDIADLGKEDGALGRVRADWGEAKTAVSEFTGQITGDEPTITKSLDNMKAKTKKLANSFANDDGLKGKINQAFDALEEALKPTNYQKNYQTIYEAVTDMNTSINNNASAWTSAKSAMEAYWVAAGKHKNTSAPDLTIPDGTFNGNGSQFTESGSGNGDKKINTEPWRIADYSVSVKDKNGVTQHQTQKIVDKEFGSFDEAKAQKERLEAELKRFGIEETWDFNEEEKLIYLHLTEKDLQRLKNISIDLKNNNIIEDSAEAAEARRHGANVIPVWEYLQKLGYFNDMASLDTGGYTGEWGSQGRAAILHEKELVLNKADTENILNAVKIIRDVDTLINNASKGYNMIKDNINSAINGITNNSSVNQNITINAEFPDAQDHDEIKVAFENLITMATQRAFS